MLQPGQCLQGAGGVDGGEALAIALVAAEEADAAACLCSRTPVIAADIAPEAGGGGLDRGGVGAGFVEHVADEEGAGGGGEDAVGFCAGGLVVDVGGGVDGAGDGGRSRDVACGAEGIGGEELLPLRVAEVATHTDGGGVLAAADCTHLSESSVGALGDDINDAAERAGAVEVGAAAGRNGDGFQDRKS